MSGMSYQLISRQVWTSREYRGASLTEVGVWSKLMNFCTDQMNGGVIVGFGSWSKKEVRYCIGVPYAKVARGGRLWFIDERGDLFVFGYAVDKEAAYRAKASGGRLAAAVRGMGNDDEGGVPVAQDGGRSVAGCGDEQLVLGVPVVSVAESSEVAGAVVGVGVEEEREVIKYADGAELGVVSGSVSGDVVELESVSGDVPDHVVVGVGAVVEGEAEGVALCQEERLREVEGLERELEGLAVKRLAIDVGDAGYVDLLMKQSELSARIRLLRFPASGMPCPAGAKGAAEYDVSKVRAVFERNAGGDRGQILVCVNEVWPKWKKFRFLSGEEEVLLGDQLENFRVLSAKDWDDFRRYYRRWCERGNRSFWCPGSRARFLRDALSIYGSCLAVWLNEGGRG